MSDPGQYHPAEEQPAGEQAGELDEAASETVEEAGEPGETAGAGDTAGPEEAAGTGDGVEPGKAPQPAYGSVEEWVRDYFVPVYRRTLGGEFRWCARWWEHAEAISRLSALWQAWEALRLQPGTGVSTWYAQHLDHHLPILMGARGPFYQCGEDAHRDPCEARTEPAPPGWWDAEGSTQSAISEGN